MAKEVHVDVDATQRFDHVWGEWQIFGWTYAIEPRERSGHWSATDGGVRVLDKR